MKKILTILFIVQFHSLNSQNLIYVRDSNLRKYFIENKYTTNDSLDLKKIKNVKRLNLFNLKISDINEVKYFISLEELYCPKNQISKLPKLPPSLLQLNCSQNKIKKIAYLPEKLRFLEISDNQLKRIPKLPQSLTFLNYHNNPIKLNKLDDEFKKAPCDDPYQNCLPSIRIKWKLFGINKEFKPSDFAQVDTIRISINIDPSWGFGASQYRFIFKQQDSVFSVVNSYYKREKNDWFRNDTSKKTILKTNFFEYKLNREKLNHVLQKIINPTLQFNNLDFDCSYTNFNCDLLTLKNGEGPLIHCSDATGYTIIIEFCHGKNILLTIPYGFDSCEIDGICTNKGNIQNVKKILEWLYFYQISHLLLSSSFEINEHFFNNKQLLNNINKLK